MWLFDNAEPSNVFETRERSRGRDERTAPFWT